MFDETYSVGFNPYDDREESEQYYDDAYYIEEVNGFFCSLNCGDDNANVRSRPDTSGIGDRYLESLAIAKEGYLRTMINWQDDCIAQEFPNSVGAMNWLKQVLYAIFNELEDPNIVNRIAQQKRDRRLVVVTYGIILKCLEEAGYCNEPEEGKIGMRTWQKALVIQIALYFTNIAIGNINGFCRSLHYPPFLLSPLFTLPTGSGKTFAGLLCALAMCVRTSGDRVMLMTPRNAHVIWAVPTRTLVDDIKGAFERVVATPSFSYLTSAILRKDSLVDRIVTRGAGGISPDVKNKMFAIATYEHCRTQLMNVMPTDTGNMQAKRPALFVAMRLVVIDEAHYIAKGEDRSLIVDNIVNTCLSYSIPVVFLTATPSPAFGDFIRQAFVTDVTPLPMNLIGNGTPTYIANFDDPKAQQNRAFKINYFNCLVSDAQINSKKALNNSDIKTDIAAINKIIAYRCIVESIFNNNERAIFFIQSIEQVQLIASYMVGLYMIIYNSGNFSNFLNDLTSKINFYIQDDYIYFEGLYNLKKVTQEQLIECFFQGVEDICGSRPAFGDPSVSQIHRIQYQNFITYLCLCHGIIPYFSNFAVNQKESDELKAKMIGNAANYRIVVTTSAVLEGVNIDGAVRLYVTPLGYKLITDTQYIQLTGRVGRHCDGFVETYLPCDFVGSKAFVRKTKSVVNEEEKIDTCRVVESDDLIDRILAIKRLNDKAALEASDFSNRDLYKLSHNRITNNYYRGEIIPRLSAFFIPASFPEGIWQYEQQSVHYDKDLQYKNVMSEAFNNYYNDNFSGEKYTTFFSLSNKLREESAPPHTILDIISFASYLNEELQRTPSLAERQLAVPTALFVTLFSDYSFAFAFDNSTMENLNLGVGECLFRSELLVEDIFNN